MRSQGQHRLLLAPNVDYLRTARSSRKGDKPRCSPTSGGSDMDMTEPGAKDSPSVDRPTRIAAGTSRPEDPLALVLGPLRAQTLRAARHPITAGRLATRLQCAPNTVTYHCAQLESAGLIVRERRGPWVWITRTRRGEQLIEAFAPKHRTYPGASDTLGAT